MKIGILTFHRANNLGAVLQAFALQKYIGDNLCRCDIVDFYPNNDIPKEYRGMKKILRICKRIMTYSFTSEKRKREKKFDDFRKQYYILTEKSYYGDNSVIDKLKEYDVLISGSDQILNTILTGCSKAYYLYFFNGRKISYASSFGRCKISSDEVNLIKSELIKFSSLSVREKSAVDIIKEIIGKEAQLVLDPVFLLGREEWSKMCSKNSLASSKYIFVYSMETSAIIEDVVRKLRSETGLPVVAVSGGGKFRVKSVMKDFECGPKEFLKYIRDAEYIVTNSFHGIAFSLRFGKRFYCVAHSSRNTRLENILQLIDQKEKIISSVADSFYDKIIDQKENLDILERYIDISKEYLIRNLR